MKGSLSLSVDQEKWWLSRGERICMLTAVGDHKDSEVFKLPGNAAISATLWCSGPVVGEKAGRVTCWTQNQGYSMLSVVNAGNWA